MLSPFPVLNTRPVDELQWRTAARSAAGLLMIDNLRLLGTVKGGPPVPRRQCEEVLAAAAAMGLAPSLEGAIDAADSIRQGWEEAEHA